ncbi:MAG TPA: SUMF1/EgtB/PvdO family nonheme iron enzyme [Synechococcales cyanobacterium M55_K2018_004]|nr:SUMF1/EgtB/PvdO family nonheme iron enzyme [Synechococcales cyanobacterium M55_K2018_004]
MGENWAIAIGINHYSNLQSLHYAKQDAASVCDYFRELQFRQIYYFADDAPPIPAPYGPPLDSKPGYTQLRRFLRTRFEQPFLKPGDNLWFFFAGHGGRDAGRDYLLPTDADPGDIPGTALAIQEVSDRLRSCGADNVILLLDACRTDDRRDGVGVGTETQQGVITIYSCSPNEASYEIAELQHGAFTYALLQGLRIQGEGNCATVERLDQYLRTAVPDLNRRHNKPPQNPYTIPEPLHKRHLILLPDKAEPGDVVTLKNAALEAEAEHNLDLAESLWLRVLAASKVDQQAIKALQRIAVKRHASPTPDPIPPPPSPPTGSRTSGSPPATPTIESQPSPSSQPTLQHFEFQVGSLRVEKSVQSSGFLGLGQKETIAYGIDRKPGQAKFFIEDLGNGVTLEMVVIPGGTFQMGSKEYSAEQPIHRVTIAPFCLGKYPVTQAQWNAVAGFPKVKIDLNPDPSAFKGGDRPVECISWLEAVEFCDRLNRFVESRSSHQPKRTYRLPSEAEWEYACRAGTTTPFHFGETITTDLANYDGNYTYGSEPKGEFRQQTTPVGSFAIANAFGLYDMHGNVWEWCADHWHENYQGAPTDGSAWITGGDGDRRLLRGGSWLNYPWYCRSASRVWAGADDRFDCFGFRLACSLPGL